MCIYINTEYWPEHSFNELISNYIVFMFKTNEPIKVIHLLKLASQSMLNGTLVIEIVSNSFSGNKKSFGRLMKLGTFSLKKNEIWAVKNIFPLDFTKYLSYSEVEKNSKVVNV